MVTLDQYEAAHDFGKPGAYLRAARWVRIIKILQREAHAEVDEERARLMHDDVTRLMHELGISWDSE